MELLPDSVATRPDPAALAPDPAANLPDSARRPLHGEQGNSAGSPGWPRSRHWTGPWSGARPLALAGMAGTGICAVIIGLLHIVGPDAAISPISRTISEYGLTSAAWAFDLAVIALAAGSAAIFGALMVADRSAPRSAGNLFAAIWVAGLLTLMLFPKANWAIGPSTSGQVHRMASLLAFLALPVAAIVLSRSGLRGTAARRSARWALGLGVAALLWFTPLLWAIVFTPDRWWLRIPLGLVERGMAVTELAALVALALFALPVRRAPAGRTRGPAQRR